MSKGGRVVVRNLDEFRKIKSRLIAIFKGIPPDTIALWSARTEVAPGTEGAVEHDGKWFLEGPDQAMKAARSMGLATLESTLMDNKIDLPAWGIPPQSETEQIWQEVSKNLATFAVSENFYVIAGESLRPGAVVNHELEKLSAGHEATVIDNASGAAAGAEHELTKKAQDLARNKSRTKAPLDTGLKKKR